MRNSNNFDFNLEDDGIQKFDGEKDEETNTNFPPSFLNESNPSEVEAEIKPYGSRTFFTVLGSENDLINASKKMIVTALLYFENNPGEVEFEIKINFMTSYSVLKFSNEYYVSTHHTLGRGGYGEVKHGALFSVKDNNPEFLCYVAVKIIEDFIDENIDRRGEVEKEKRLMTKAHSEFSSDIINKLSVIERQPPGVVSDRINYYFIQPLLSGKSLSDLIDQKKITNETEVYEIIIGVIRKVRRIHEMHIIHGDLNSRQFLYDKENNRVSLVDFGKSDEQGISEVWAVRDGRAFEVDILFKVNGKFTEEQGKAAEICALAFLINELIDSYYSLDDSRLKPVRDYLQTMKDSDPTKRPSIEKVESFFKANLGTKSALTSNSDNLRNNKEEEKESIFPVSVNTNGNSSDLKVLDLASTISSQNNIQVAKKYRDNSPASIYINNPSRAAVMVGLVTLGILFGAALALCISGHVWAGFGAFILAMQLKASLMTFLATSTATAAEIGAAGGGTVGFLCGHFGVFRKTEHDKLVGSVADEMESAIALKNTKVK